jgi:hypothetical protein
VLRDIPLLRSLEIIEACFYKRFVPNGTRTIRGRHPAYAQSPTLRGNHQLFAAITNSTLQSPILRSFFRVSEFFIAAVIAAFIDQFFGVEIILRPTRRTVGFVFFAAEVGVGHSLLAPPAVSGHIALRSDPARIDSSSG